VAASWFVSFETGGSIALLVDQKQNDGIAVPFFIK